MIDATPLLRLYARHRLRALERQDPAAAQERTLLHLVRRARRTRFGRDHGFAAIRSVREYQQRVPLRRYDDFWREYWEPHFPRLTNCTWPGIMPYFADTSGTSTGVRKHIPVSRAMLSSNARAVFELFVHHLARHRESRLFAGKSLMLGSSAGLIEAAPGIHHGDLSSIAVSEVPRWVSRFAFPGPRLAAEPDWEKYADRLARLSLKEDIRSFGGTPSWMLLFVEKLLKLRPGARGIADLYPHLELLVHGGVDFRPYHKMFDRLLAGSRAELREVYPASEGFIAVGDRGSGEGLRLLLDNGLFFEFVPVAELDSSNPARRWLADVKTGTTYAIVLTSCAGLWSYILGDTIRFIDTKPGRLLVTGRTTYFLSAFGEHLSGEHIADAVAEAAAAIDAGITDYTVGPIFPANPGEQGRHLFIIEFAPPVPEGKRRDLFAEVLDTALQRASYDYEQYRSGNARLAAPKVHVASPGTFAEWMRKVGKLGGQNKVPRITTDPERILELWRFAGGELATSVQ